MNVGKEYTDTDMYGSRFLDPDNLPSFSYLRQHSSRRIFEGVPKGDVEHLQDEFGFPVHPSCQLLHPQLFQHECFQMQQNCQVEQSFHFIVHYLPNDGNISG